MKSGTVKKKANQKNAEKSTGPKTEKGKQAIALNGIAHGLRSLKPVIPWLESEEDWTAHRDQLIAHLQPANVLESALADRIALGLWRLARSVETEPGILHAAREKRRWRAIGNAFVSEGIRNYNESTKATFARLNSEREHLCALSKIWVVILTESADSAPDPDLANDVIDSICSPENWTALGDAFNETFEWPPARMSDLRSMVEWLIEYLGEDASSSVEEYAEAASARALSATELIRRIEEESKQAADLALVESDVLDKLHRYETTIHRALQKDLHELQRLQALRSGQPVAAPIAIDLTSDS